MSVQEMYSRLPLQRSALRPPLLLKRILDWISSSRDCQTRALRLRVVERVTLGEKSALSVVHVDGRRFLLASGPVNVALLTELSPEEKFTTTLSEALMTSIPSEGKPRTRRSRNSKVSVGEVAA